MLTVLRVRVASWPCGRPGARGAHGGVGVSAPLWQLIGRLLSSLPGSRLLAQLYSWGARVKVGPYQPTQPVLVGKDLSPEWVTIVPEHLGRGAMSRLVLPS